MMNNKFIFLLIGASGSGKTTITEQLEQRYGLKSIQSYTTRKPRYDGETGHIFVSDEEFDKLTDMVAYTEFAGNRYCATAEQVETHDLYVIDPDGIDYFREHYKGKKTPKIIFIIADMETRYERMVQRSEKKGNTYLTAVDEALARIKNDIVEFYDYVQDSSKVDCTINNIDNLDSAVEKVYNFICSCEGGDEN